MSRSNHDKPFYVDVGTSIVAVRCASNHDVVLRYDHSQHPFVVELSREICDRMNREVEIHNSGNAAKLREALEFSDKELRKATEADRFGDDPVYLVGCMRTVANVCRTALAAPPRNCDVGTVWQQDERFYAFCKRHFNEVGLCDKSCPCRDFNMIGGACPIVWAQMPYEEGGAK